LSAQASSDQVAPARRTGPDAPAAQRASEYRAVKRRVAAAAREFRNEQERQPGEDRAALPF